MIKRMGVYQVINLVNGKRYVGASTNLQSRKRQHFSELKLNKHGNPNLQSEYNQYGKKNFFFSVIEIIKDENILIEREQNWLDELQPEYNINKVAGKYMGEYIRTPEALAKRKETKKGYKKSQSEIEHHREAMIKHFETHNDHPFQNFTSEQKREFGRKGALARQEKGYKHKENTKQKIGNANAKTYFGFVDPDGNIYSPIHNLKQFCEKYTLGLSSMVALDHGRISKHKGWKKLAHGQHKDQR